jgi:polyhydroxyalkanoate synthase
VTILRTEIVDQAIDVRSGRHGRFVKEVILARGVVPLSMVRKRVAASGVEVGARATLLLVHGFGQNRYAWHLPSRSMVNHLAAAGFDVFNLDLRGQGRSRLVGARVPKRMAEYVEEDIPRALDEVRRVTGRDDVFLIGHSLGGLLSYAAAPASTDRVRGIVTIGSPYVFTRGSATLATIGALLAGLDRIGIRPNGAGLRLRGVGAGLSALRRYLESPLYPVKLRGWHAGAIEPEILDEHLRYAFDLASLEVMATLFRGGGRAFGSSEIHGGDVGYAERFERCSLPLLVIAGTEDDLAPPASVEPAYLRSRAPDKSYRELPLGHIDLLVGRDAPRTTWMIVEKWLRERAALLPARTGSRGFGGQEDVP